MKILHLTLYRTYYNQIVIGEKKVEYREIKPYWTKRLFSKVWTHVYFTNGYGKHRPSVLVEVINICTNARMNRYEIVLGQVMPGTY